MHVGLGCVRLGGGDGRSVGDDIRLVQGAIDLGVTVFDTADAYGGGASERVLGKAVRDHRDDVVLATKAGFVFRDRTAIEQWTRRRVKDVIGRLPSRRGNLTNVGGSSGAYARQDFSPGHIRAAVHASLRRLGTDRIDVFQLHDPTEKHPDLVERLIDLVAAGDIVRIGIGAGSVDVAASWIGVEGVDVLQVPFGVLDPSAATRTMPRARDADQEVWIRGLHGGGLLAQARRQPAGLADHPKHQVIERLMRLADQTGVDLHHLALAFAHRHAAGFSTAIVGSTSLEHLADNVAILTGPPLADDLVEAVDQIASAPGDDGNESS